tara:strand:+ start:269 stop:1159 length:891 start_codon:yes stop_codon:yes gene_type:complete
MFNYEDAFELLAHEGTSDDLGFLRGWSLGESPSPFDASGNIIVGDPIMDSSFHDQQDSMDTCAIVSQKMILEQFGIDTTENALVYESLVNGWYTPGYGTPVNYAAELLELHGVDTHTIEHASFADLISELNQGHKVIVGVDSSELTRPDSPLAEYLDDQKADHAVVVTGMSFDSSGEPIVYLNDPASPFGGKPVPLSVFEAAWEDSGNHIVATDHAPDDLANHPVFGEFFNGETGSYRDDSYWDSWHSKGALLRAGAIGAAAAGALVNHVKSKSDKKAKSCKTLSDKDRNSLLRTI